VPLFKKSVSIELRIGVTLAKASISIVLSIAVDDLTELAP
jgi:hypothetical protein